MFDPLVGFVIVEGCFWIGLVLMKCFIHLKKKKKKKTPRFYIGKMRNSPYKVGGL
jgi:hypothetical protein